MRYVDIGTLNSPASPASRQSAGSRQLRQKPSKAKRWFRGAIGMVLLGALMFGIYSFLPPIKETVASIFNGSGAVFSYIVKGEQQLKQDGGKTNVLLLGIDKRADEPYTFQGRNGVISHNGFRTDTMIIASYNYDSKKTTMLSIPRDLWVKVPGFGEVRAQSMKINGVYAIGDIYGYPGGGMALTTKVVSDYFGVPLHYTARVDFAGVVQAIDAVGGIDVTVENAFTDNMYPIEGKETAWPESSRYKRISFKAGLQHMNGTTALEYARSRHAFGVEGSDFSRAKRQQKVISAFRDKVFSSETAMNITALNQLYKALGDSFVTDISTTDLPAAYTMAKEMDGEPATYNLDDDQGNPGGLLYAPPAAGYNGAYVLVPRDATGSDLREFVQQVFSSQGYVEPTPSPTPTPKAKTIR